MKNHERLYTWFHDVWINGRTELIEPMFHPDLNMKGPLHGAVTAAEDYAEIVMTLKARLTGLELEKTHGLDDGNLSCVRIHVTGTGFGGAGPLDYFGVLVVEFKDGQIRDFLSNFDYVTMLEQLGQLPPECLPICMTGERLIWASDAGKSGSSPDDERAQTPAQHT